MRALRIYLSLPCLIFIDFTRIIYSRSDFVHGWIMTLLLIFEIINLFIFSLRLYNVPDFSIEIVLSALEPEFRFLDLFINTEF